MLFVAAPHELADDGRLSLAVAASRDVDSDHCSRLQLPSGYSTIANLVTLTTIANL